MNPATARRPMLARDSSGRPSSTARSTTLRVSWRRIRTAIDAWAIRSFEHPRTLPYY